MSKPLEASLLAAAQTIGFSQFQLSFSLTVCYTAYTSRDFMWIGLLAWEDSLHKHTASLQSLHQHNYASINLAYPAAYLSSLHRVQLHLPVNSAPQLAYLKTITDSWRRYVTMQLSPWVYPSAVTARHLCEWSLLVHECQGEVGSSNCINNCWVIFGNWYSWSYCWSSLRWLLIIRSSIPSY